MAHHESAYDSVFIEALQWMWGDGFLSPGGPEEVAALLTDVDITGSRVLDVGSGLGAADVLLVTEHKAGEVVGIDVEPHLVDRAIERVAAAGLQDRISFRLVEPGPLPFSPEEFDVVFTKDAIVHIPDKQGFYADVLRVLRPGGRFVGSDWLRGGPETFTEEARRWLEILHLNFEMQDLDATKAALEASGFGQVSMSDRNAWYREAIKDELATLSGDRYAQLAAMIGDEQAAYRHESSSSKKEAIDCGFLRPTHFVATKPAS